MRNWADEEIRARGFDPATGARVATAGPKPNLEPPKHGLSAAARANLRPEQRLQVEVIETLRPKLVEGAKLIGTNGEIPEGSRLGELAQAVRNAMGYEAGLPDMVAYHAGRGYFVELKRPRGEADLLGRRTARGELSTPQRGWRAWAEAQGFPTAVCRSVSEVEAALKGWGLIAG